MGISALLAAQILDASATGRSVLTGADASAIRTTLGLGTLATQSPTGTPSASTFLRGDYSWQTIDLSGYVPYTGASGAVNLGANAFTASRATLATGTITASTPAINVSQTWNNAATTFTGILANVTDTASNASSLLLDLQVGGSSKFSVDKSGRLLFSQTILNGKVILYTTNDYTSGFYGFGINASTLRFQIPDSSANFTFFSGTSEIYKLSGSKSFTINNTFTDSSNYERAKIAWESNVLRIGTEKAGTGSARALELQTDGVTRLTIGTDGTITSANTLVLADTSLILQLGSNSGTQVRRAASSQNVMLRSSSITTMQGSAVSQIGATRGLLLGDVDYSDCYVSTGGFGGDIYIAPNVMGNSSRNGGNLRLFGGTASSVGNWNGGHVYLDGGALNGTGVNGSFIIGSVRSTLTCFGGTTSSFPAIKRNAAALNFRLADDSADCDITAKAATFSGNVTVSAVNIVTDTTTGTKIGTATTQKLGFYNATPVVQPAAVADATDAASVITQLNALLSRMRDLGLIAT